MTGLVTLKGCPKPEGYVRVVTGQEYETNRSLADKANNRMHKANPSLHGLDIHEIKPVQFGGSPVDPRNKIPLPRAKHVEFSRWWAKLFKAVTR